MDKITATASDATLLTVMENWINGSFVYRVDDTNIGITTGSVMIDGELRRITSAKTDLTFDTTSTQWIDVWLNRRFSSYPRQHMQL